jgi:hypothetical protein
MANSNGWGDGAANNAIGWGQGANNAIGWGKSQIDSWSGATDIDGGNTPVNSVAPALSGTAQEGQTLTCSTGTWSGSPTYSYQWKRNGSNIGSATNSTYTLVTADVGQSIKCTVTATNFVGSANADSNTVTPTSSTDADAQAFITAASITDPTQQAAINQLVVSLKGYSLWTKMKAVYPFVGGTSTTHKWNLKNPLDTDAAFRMTFHGGVTHSSNGITFATNGYADTKWLPSANSTTSNVSGGAYSRTNLTADYALLGSLGFSFNGLLITPKSASGITYYGANNYIVDGSGNFVTDTRGLFHVNRDSSTVSRLYRNGTSISTTTPSISEAPIYAVYLGARNKTGTAESYFNGNLAFAFLGDTLNSTEATNLYTAVQAFQTTLGRNV